MNEINQHKNYCIFLVIYVTERSLTKGNLNLIFLENKTATTTTKNSS